MKMNAQQKVAVVMGSDSDFAVAKKCIIILKEFGVEYEVLVCSAHRTPDKASGYAKAAEERGIGVIIAAAGKAAHLPGIMAAYAPVPVIGIPVKSSTMDGLDSLLSIVQMPTGVPVASVAIDGAENAALLALQILSISNRELSKKIKEYKKKLALDVEEKNMKLKEILRKEGL
jgi:5-(carboxyamino)imidazole ribonucleotide mutase